MGNKLMWIYSIVSINGKYSHRWITNTNYQINKNGFDAGEGISIRWIENDRHGNIVGGNKTPIILNSIWMFTGRSIKVNEIYMIFDVF